MRLRTIVTALVIATPLLVLESRPAAAFGWCDWGWGYGSSSYYSPRTYGYAAPRTYRYYGYAPRFYGSYYYGRRWGWRGYGYRGWRGHGYRAWRGYGYRGWHGARVSGVRAGVRAVRR
jgi:hypothetical protein